MLVTLRSIAIFMAIFIVVVAAVFLIGNSDEYGWIPHSRQSTITARQDWIIGESKTCTSFALDPSVAKLSKGTPYDVTGVIQCDDGPTHEIKITFWGKTERPDKKSTDGILQWNCTWKCTRKSDSFTCLALNWYQPWFQQTLPTAWLEPVSNPRLG